MAPARVEPGIGRDAMPYEIDEKDYLEALREAERLDILDDVLEGILLAVTAEERKALGGGM